MRSQMIKGIAEVLYQLKSLSKYNLEFYTNPKSRRYMGLLGTRKLYFEAKRRGFYLETLHEALNNIDPNITNEKILFFEPDYRFDEEPYNDLFWKNK